MNTKKLPDRMQPSSSKGVVVSHGRRLSAPDYITQEDKSNMVEVYFNRKTFAALANYLEGKKSELDKRIADQKKEELEGYAKELYEERIELSSMMADVLASMYGEDA